LRRRQVFRAVAWYAAAAWAAIQVASTVFPEFGLPEWSVRAVIVAALLGLPVAVALAWWFDVSALSLRRESAAPGPSAPGDERDRRAEEPSAAQLWRTPSFWIALVLGAGVAVSAQQAWQRVIRPAFGERPGIAVLPLANLSPDPANAYFADGLHEEIIATLARISGLRVISRTSVREFRDAKRNLREIAEALGVPLILEGSVRRDGDALRLTLQLIDGRTDEHLWAETYDGSFENALDLQSRIAQEIVAAIGAQLTSSEDHLIASTAPASSEAYAYYLQALAKWSQLAELPELKVTEGLLGRALELDPAFALGHALRAKVRIWMATAHDVPPLELDAAVEGARRDIARALELETDLPEALTARAMYATYVLKDAAAALPDLDRALERAPNDGDAQSIAGLTLRRLGRFDEALAHVREAARLMPMDPAQTMRVYETLAERGRFEEALAMEEDFSRRFPRLSPVAELGAYRLRYVASGETAGWEEAYDRLAPRLPPTIRTYQLVRMKPATGDLPGLAAALEAATDPASYESLTDRALFLGLVYAAMGELPRARPHLEQTAAELARLPDGISSPELAVVLQLLGRNEDAVRAADEAVVDVPESRDAVNGPTVAIYRAWVLIRVGGPRAEEGYAELSRLLGAFRLQPREFATMPLGIMLRDDPRANRIIEEAIARTTRPPS
jgi:TolB-like protein